MTNEIYTASRAIEVQNERWNAKYSAFYVTRYSMKAGRSVQVGKVHRTVEAALAACRRIDARNPTKQRTFIDVVKP